MSKPLFSIIIPSYNEEDNLRNGVLQDVDTYLSKQDYQVEVIIVDDGSKDQSIQLIEDFIENKKNYRLIRNNHGGKAIAVMTGMIESKGEIALFTDMDQATPLREIEKLMPKFEAGYDIVFGSRKGRKGAPAIRKLMAWGFSVLRTILLGLPFKDTQCGFKAFNRESIDKVFKPLLVRWQKHLNKKGAAVNAGFDVETLFLAKKIGFKIAEVPVEWHYVGTERVQAIRDSLDALQDMVKIRINDFAGSYQEFKG
jgi:glycosyltransferase involved in cell wall biosynthesis